MLRKSLVVVVVLAVVLSASLVVAVGPRGKGMQGAAPGPNPACPMMGGQMMGDLGLTDDQIGQMKQIHKEFFEVTKVTREQIQSKSKEMVRLWSADRPDGAAIKNLAAEIDALRAEIRNTGIDYMLRGLALLNPEQREKLRERLKDCPGMCCGLCMGPGMCCGAGFGPGMGAACPMGMRGGMGLGAGMGDATGPRAKMGTCPLMNK